MRALLHLPVPLYCVSNVVPACWYFLVRNNHMHVVKMLESTGHLLSTKVLTLLSREEQRMSLFVDWSVSFTIMTAINSVVAP